VNTALKKRLADAISGSVRAAKFCCGGTMPDVDPLIEVDQLGVLRFPLKPKAVAALVEQCAVAPFGKGVQTLVDTKVRKTFELSPERFRVSDEWNTQVAGVVARVADDLGLPPTDLHAELYKLLVYRRGGFFRPHRDSEKSDGMVGSLIIVLPNPFDGGTLTVRHSPSRQQRFSFQEAASGNCISYAAFYADCEHEVSEVFAGVRVCLCYNLTLRPAKTARGKRRKTQGDANPLVCSVHSWFAAQPSTPLVFALEHQYSERGLSGELLKGTDRSLAELLVSTAEAADCELHLAHVSRHLLQFADDGSESDWDDYGARRGSRKSRQLEIGETFEDDLVGTQWSTLAGKKQAWKNIPLNVTSIMSEIPVDEWTPTSEEYEGYTGNAGNTLDRWYHRTAIVLWPKTQHYSVLASAGLETCNPVFARHMSALAKSTKARREALRADCIRFARAIIAAWPTVQGGSWSEAASGSSDSPQTTFCDHLIKLNDQETIVALLSQVAKQNDSISLKTLIVHACSEFGIPAIATELQSLMNQPVGRFGITVQALRNLEWLEAVCELRLPESEARNIVGNLCRHAASVFCAPFAKKTSASECSWDRRKNQEEAALPLLLKALLICGCHQEFSNVIACVESNPGQLTLEHGRVPALKELIPWSLRKFGHTPPPLRQWLQDVRARLVRVTAAEPKPPADWTRPSAVACGCRHCGQLSAFLKDSTAEVGRISAREEDRLHLIREISRHRCDVTHQLEKFRSPYTLVLTKTQESFERALRRYQLDSALLKELPESPGD